MAALNALANNSGASVPLVSIVRPSHFMKAEIPISVEYTSMAMVKHLENTQLHY